MELVVKIGADQQNLQQMVDRIKTEFKKTNVSMPASWQPHNAALQQYGGIMQSASGGGFSFQKLGSEISSVSPAIGGLISKLSGLAGPIGAVGSAVTLAGMTIKGVLGEISQAANDVRTSRITGMSPLMARRLRQASDAAGIDPGGAQMMINRLNAQVGNFNAGNKEAQSLFGELGINPSGMAVDDLLMAIKGKVAGMKDPAARARLLKGLMGRTAFEGGELLSKLVPASDGDAGLSEAIRKSAEAKMVIKKIWRNITEGGSEFALRVAAGSIDIARIIKNVGKSPFSGHLVESIKGGSQAFREGGIGGLLRSLAHGGGGINMNSQIAGQEGPDTGAIQKQSEEIVKAEARYRKAAYERLSPEMKLGYLMHESLPGLQQKFQMQTKGTAEWWEAKNELEGALHDAEALRKEITKTPKAEKAEKEKPLSFQADALAQAGLFAGSSLLMNPNFTVAQEQLEVLRRIDTNTAKNLFT